MDKDHSTADSRRLEPDAKNSEGVITTHSRRRERGAINSVGISTIDSRSREPSANNETRAKVKYSRIKRRVLKHVWIVRAVILVFLTMVIGLLGLGLLIVVRNLGFGNFIKLSSTYLAANPSMVASYENKINILVLGIGGEGHEGPTLTDTILVVSIPLTGSKITTVSVQRDLWMPDIRSKINSAYYWGDQKNSGGGMALVRSKVEQVLGTQIQYGAVIDFSGFKRLIDEMGGISVNVERGFTDSLYPLAGRENDTCSGDPLFKCRYETITFSKGPQLMDGETALKFVRSRHAEGDEGTDLARSDRQQKVADGVKNKLMTPSIFLSPRKISALWEEFDEYVVTDLDISAAAVMSKLIFKSKGITQSFTIPEELLVNPPISSKYDQLYVFVPRLGNGNWKEINEWYSRLEN